MSLKNKEKLLHNIAAKYIVGENIDIELAGNPAEIDCLFELLTISKDLKAKLEDNKTSLNEIKTTLDKKKEITRRFISLTGINWSL